MRTFHKLLGAVAAIPLAIALAYPSMGTAQAQQRTPDSGGPTRNPANTSPVQPAAPTTPQRDSTPSQTAPTSGPQGGAPQRGDAGPQRGSVASNACASGFTMSQPIMGSQAGRQVYSSYACEGPLPTCPAERAASESEPALTSVTRQAAGSPEAFQVRVDYRKVQQYHCNTPTLTCVSPAANGNANRVEVELRTAFGTRLNYKCTYVWNQG